MIIQNVLKHDHSHKNSQIISELKKCTVSVSVIYIYIQLKFLLLIFWFWNFLKDGQLNVFFNLNDKDIGIMI